MRRVFFPLLLVAAGVVIYVTIRNELPPDGSGLSQRGASSSPVVATEAPQDPSIESTEKAHRSTERPEPKGEELHGFSLEDMKPLAANGDAFLTKRGVSAFNLLAVFSATGDRRFLKQALAQFPNNAAVLYVALADAPKEEREGLIERFKAVDPNNPLPWIFSAAEMFENGQTAEAIAEVREALMRPGFYTYFNERAAALRELALQSGSGEFGAESLSLFTQTLPHLQAATSVARGLQAWVDSNSAGSDRSAMRDTAVIMYDLGRMFQTPEASRLLIGQLVGCGLERKALDLIPSSDDNPLPVEYQSRTEELMKVREEANALAKSAARVYAEPALWKEYFARFRTEGEMAALRWVQQQPPAAQIPVPSKSPAVSLGPK